MTDLDTVLTALYVFLDDHLIGRRRIGRPPLAVRRRTAVPGDCPGPAGLPRERFWIRYARKNLRPLFPYIPDQSGYANGYAMRHR
jgi:hypothetical protein